MGRHPKIAEDEVIARLARVFAESGYNGASLAQLAQAAGLQKASLYHRYPGGKQQMAQQVLAAVGEWLAENVFAPLDTPETPRRRIETVAGNLDKFYHGGEKACLLNMLSSPRNDDGPISEAIGNAFEAMISAFAAFACKSGIEPGEARTRAQRAVVLMQGSLVVSRGTNSTAPFRDFISGLPDLLLPADTASPD